MCLISYLLDVTLELFLYTGSFWEAILNKNELRSESESELKLLGIKDTPLEILKTHLTNNKQRCIKSDTCINYYISATISLWKQFFFTYT